MNVNTAPLRPVHLIGCILLLGWVGSLPAAEVNVMRTNSVDRWITNVIEVRMPLNLFINEYHTNWLEQKRTNMVDVYATNRVVIEALRTNFVKGYHTNWANVTQTNDVQVEAYRTNFLTAYQTNWNTSWVTNEVAVNLFDTNYVAEYHTNSRTLFVTNWETVLIMKTNWIFQPITNVVQIDMVGNRSAGTQPTTVRPGNESAGSRDNSPNPSTLSSDLVIEASTTGRVNTNQIEVQLRATWGADPRILLQVQRWRVEREDATILSFGQEAVFRRMLPPGRYRVEVRAQKDVNGPMLSARGILVLGPHEAVVQPQLAARQ